jgi:hypothetical protein
MKKDTNKTAMEELIDDIQQAFEGQWGVYLNSEKFAPYLEKEKQQIINAAKSCNYIGGATDIEAEKYYNQTYNK